MRVVDTHLIGRIRHKQHKYVITKVSQDNAEQAG